MSTPHVQQGGGCAGRRVQGFIQFGGQHAEVALAKVAETFFAQRFIEHFTVAMHVDVDQQ